MKNFFKNLFNKPIQKENLEKEVEMSVSLSEAQILSILGKAISDLGYWSWWATDLPKVIQIEFGRTQLYFPPKDSTLAPNTQLAIQFVNPKSISYLSRAENSEVTQNWFNDLHNDKLEHPFCNDEEFTFTDFSKMTAIINRAKTINTIFGYNPSDNEFKNENYKLVFWADDYGFAVASEKMYLLTKEDYIELDQIPSLHSDWWAYWKKYWDLKNSENALPKDFACEITLPLKKE